MGWGNPNKVGMVYKTDLVRSHDSHAMKVGNFKIIVLCVEHTGDCHYTWAKLREEVGNEHDRYFSIQKIYSAYGVDGEELLKEPLKPRQIVSSLVSVWVDGRAGVVVPKPERECMVHGCTNKKSQGTFIGDMCVSCYKSITTGKVAPTDSFLKGLL